MDESLAAHLPWILLSKGHHVEMRILSVLIGGGASIDSHSWPEPGGDSVCHGS